MKPLHAILLALLSSALSPTVLSGRTRQSCSPVLPVNSDSSSPVQILPEGLKEARIEAELLKAPVTPLAETSPYDITAEQASHFHSHMRHEDKEMNEIAEKLKYLKSLDSSIGKNTTYHRFQYGNDGKLYLVPGTAPIGINVDNSKAVRDFCPWTNHNKPNCKSSGSQEYRTIEGDCNNKKTPIYGKQDTPFQRLLEPDYFGDNFGLRRSTRGKELPNARKITTTAFKTGEQTSNRISELFTQFGQFVDHDLAHAPVPPSSPKTSCCNKDPKGRPWVFPSSTELSLPARAHCIPIRIFRNDPFWEPQGRTCLSLERNLISPTLRCEVGKHEQTNALTHWLDLSNTYGNTQDEHMAVRDGSSSHSWSFPYLKTTDINGESIPPSCPKKAEPKIEACGDFCKDEKLQCVFSGDLRINEQPGLTLVHLQWIRNHNRLVRKLKEEQQNVLYWSNERIFEEARRINIAMFQHVLYNEWLPIVLGRKYMEDFDLLPRESGHTMDYNPDLDPRVTNEFSAAAFRFGHSMVKSTIPQWSKRNGLVSESRLKDGFFNMTVLREEGFIENVIRGNTRESAANVDGQFAEDLTNFLFANIQSVKEYGGLDLMSINIQRGRSRGIPGYNRYREMCACGQFKEVFSFDELSGEGGFHSEENVRKLKSLYKHVDDIDLFVGGILEIPDDDAILGPTFKCIVGDQFLRLKRGDRFWYENKHEHGFTEDQLTEIRKFTHASLLCNNFNLDKIQPSPFRTNKYGDNPLTRCDHFPEIDLSVF